MANPNWQTWLTTANPRDMNGQEGISREEQKVFFFNFNHVFMEGAMCTLAYNGQRVSDPWRWRYSSSELPRVGAGNQTQALQEQRAFLVIEPLLQPQQKCFKSRLRWCFSFIFMFTIYMHMYVFVWMHDSVQRPEEANKSPGAGVTGGCWEDTQVFCKPKSAFNSWAISLASGMVFTP